MLVATKIDTNLHDLPTEIAIFPTPDRCKSHPNKLKLLQHDKVGPTKSIEIMAFGAVSWNVSSPIQQLHPRDFLGWQACTHRWYMHIGYTLLFRNRPGHWLKGRGLTALENFLLLRKRQLQRSHDTTNIQLYYAVLWNMKWSRAKPLWLETENAPLDITRYWKRVKVHKMRCRQSHLLRSSRSFLRMFLLREWNYLINSGDKLQLDPACRRKKNTACRTPAEDFLIKFVGFEQKRIHSDCCFPINFPIWVCLKMGYTPNYSHLVGIMIINHWV